MRLASGLIALPFAAFCLVSTQALADRLLGSGSTFVFPIMAAWSEAYQKQEGVELSYQAIGSSGGIRELRAGVVEFGISDAPLKPEELTASGFVQFPIVTGGIVPVVNLDGVQPGQLKFTGQLLADIYLGKIKTWADPAIAVLNPGIALPDRRILPVFRTDGSGTTYNWTDYLSRVSGDWKSKVGAGTSVSWPGGSGGNGNGGVADAVARVKGAIGYVEFSYALKGKLPYGLVQNRAGNFVTPSAASFRAAAEAADWASARDFYLLMTDSPGPQAYPITASSFVLMPAKPANEAHTRDLLTFFKWALEHGQQQADALGYVPLPSSLVERIEAYWQARFK